MNFCFFAAEKIAAKISKNTHESKLRKAFIVKGLICFIASLCETNELPHINAVIKRNTVPSAFLVFITQIHILNFSPANFVASFFALLFSLSIHYIIAYRSRPISAVLLFVIYTIIFSVVFYLPTIYFSSDIFPPDFLFSVLFCFSSRFKTLTNSSALGE